MSDKAGFYNIEAIVPQILVISASKMAKNDQNWRKSRHIWNTRKIILLLELLSPAMQPIQLTQDLANFWHGSYQLVKKDMKGRYPKHYWPEDPAIAMPTTRVKKHMHK